MKKILSCLIFIIGLACYVCFAEDWFEAEEATSRDYIGPVGIIEARGVLSETDIAKYIPNYTEEDLRDVSRAEAREVLPEVEPIVIQPGDSNAIVPIIPIDIESDRILIGPLRGKVTP